MAGAGVGVLGYGGEDDAGAVLRGAGAAQLAVGGKEAGEGGGERKEEDKVGWGSHCDSVLGCAN